MKTIFITLLLVLFSFIFYISDLKSYGATWDELIFHLNTGKEYLNFIKTGNLGNIMKAENSSWFPPIAPTIGYFFVKNTLLKKVFPLDTDRFHIAGIFFGSLTIGVVFMIAYFLTQRKSIGLFSGILLLTNSQFVTQLHNNIRDTSLAFFYSLTILSLLVWYKSKYKLLMSVICGVFTGITIDTKQNGGFLVFISIIFFLINIKHTGWKKFLAYSFLYLFSAIATFFIFWPYLWIDTYKHLLSVWDFLTNPGIIAGLTLFYDKTYISLKNIPFYYPWVMLGILHTPVFVLVVIIGVFISIGSLFKDKKKFLIFLWLFIPLSRFFIPKSAIAFDQIRHFFEVVPSLPVFAGIVLDFFNRIFAGRKKEFYIIVAFASIVVFYNLYIFLKYKPYGTAYFNMFAGSSSYVNHAFDVEYFGNVYREATEYLKNNYSDDVKYYTAGLGAHIFENNGLKNSKTDNIDDEFNYVIFMNKQTWIRNNSYVMWLLRNKKPIYTIEREGKILFYQFLPYKKEYLESIGKI